MGKMKMRFSFDKFEETFFLFEFDFILSRWWGESLILFSFIYPQHKFLSYVHMIRIIRINEGKL